SLIRFWIAEGFIELSDETNEMSMEDIGNQYINDLLGSPIFEDVEMDELDIEADESGCVKTFRLDCITHDFAREVAILRLCLSDCQDILFVQSISSGWYLQTLVLRGCNSLTVLPRDISTLINLRYLDASRTRVTVLPSQIGALKQLQHLDVSDTNIKVIPPLLK
ncbi:hypothetical protein MKW92_040833, partial [Papaver armeniacum]